MQITELLLLIRNPVFRPKLAIPGHSRVLKAPTEAQKFDFWLQNARIFRYGLTRIPLFRLFDP